MLMVVLYSVSSLFRLSSFGSRVFMRLTGILLGTLSFRMWRGVLIPQSLPCSAVILTLFLTAFWTVLARTLLILPVRAQLRFHVSSRPVLFSTSGATYIRLPTVSPGRDGTALFPLVLIFLGFLSLGFLLSLPVIFFLSRFLTTVRFTYLSLSLKPLSQVLGSGS